MGEARRRGTFEERKKQGIERVAAEEKVRFEMRHTRRDIGELQLISRGTTRKRPNALGSLLAIAAACALFTSRGP